jgi:hypothetical protein
MATTIRPLHERIIVKRLDEQEQMRGGIIIPDTAKEKPQQGEVIAAGEGKFRDDGTRQPLDARNISLCARTKSSASLRQRPRPNRPANRQKPDHQGGYKSPAAAGRQ